MTSIAPCSLDLFAFAGLDRAEPVAKRDPADTFLRLFALACLFPYPALTIGNRTGFQLSHLLTLFAIPVLLVRPVGRPLTALLAIVGPTFLSAFVCLMKGPAPEIDVLPKEAVALTLAVFVLWPTDWLNNAARFRGVLVMASWAVLAHAAVGVYQLYAFSHDEFPLLFLYRNPSFKPMESWSDLYAMYVKRPCGLFPEPSAMASALGPWVVILAGLVADPAPGAGLGITRSERRLFAAAAGAGFALMAASRTGFTVTLAAAVILICACQARSWLRTLDPRTVLSAVLLVAAIGGTLAYVKATVGAGLDERIESSWGLRGISIVAGLTANTEPIDVAFGVGPGQSTSIVRKMLAGIPRPKGQDDMAIWSLAVCHYMEMGLCGLVGIGAILAAAVLSIARSSAVVLGLSALGAWVVAVSITTSYPHLSAIWLFLGAALNWDLLVPASPVIHSEGRLS